MQKPPLRSASLLALLLQPLLACIALAQAPLAVTGLPDDVPLAVTASATATQLVVDLELRRGWHVYSRDVGGGRPVSVHVAEGGAFVAAGAQRLPMSRDGKLEGKARITLPLRRVGEGDLVATVKFQVCDALMCLLPMTATVQGAVAPPHVLTVVDVEGPRSQRIHDWLEQRGFDASVATYAAVTLEQCDAADLVLADSPYFGQYERGALSAVKAFPRTSSPVIAVGFFGTELVEAHGLAMTSGYI